MDRKPSYFCLSIIGDGAERLLEQHDFCGGPHFLGTELKSEQPDDAISGATSGKNSSPNTSKMGTEPNSNHGNTSATLLVYFDDFSAANFWKSTLDGPDSEFKVELSKLVLENWNRNWEENFTTEDTQEGWIIFKAGNTFFSDKKSPNATDFWPKYIEMEPGSAFGYGAHPSTRLMLRMLKKVAPLKGKRIMDFGCGTGILGIAAMQLGATNVASIENNETAQDIARKNYWLNSQEGEFYTTIDVFLPCEQVDIVLANVLLPVHQQYGAVLEAHLKKGGKFILAGIKTNQIDDLLQYYPYRVVGTLELEGWSALTLTK